MIINHRREVQERDAPLNDFSFQCYGFYRTLPVIALGGNVESLSLRSLSWRPGPNGFQAPGKDPRAILSWAYSELPSTVLLTALLM